MMGSSGGGFTSIMLATMLRTRCQAINPQFDFRRYKAQAVESLKSVVLKPGEDWIEERASAVAFMLSENYIPKMHILQNILVEEDIEHHILPMISNLCLAQAHCGYDRIRLDFYHHIDGHNGMPPKGKCLEYIQQDLEAPFPDDPEAQELMCDAAYLLSGKNLTVRLKAGHAPQESPEYAYYLYRGNQVVEKTGYSRDTEKTYCDLLPGRYRVKYFVRIGQLKRSFTMGSITVS